MNTILQNRLVQKAAAGLLYYGYFGFFVAVVAGYGLYYYTYERPPEQPINYSHKIHVGKLGLECTYCHATVAESTHPNIPKTEVCMGCHQAVKTDSPEIMKLTKYYEEGKEVPWNRVHQLPGHVYFSHKRHIKAGIQCESCHGQMQEMAVVRQNRSLKMGWCMACHVEKGASIECWTCHK